MAADTHVVAEAIGRTLLAVEQPQAQPAVLPLDWVWERIMPFKESLRLNDALTTGIMAVGAGVGFGVMSILCCFLGLWGVSLVGLVFMPLTFLIAAQQYERVDQTIQQTLPLAGSAGYRWDIQEQDGWIDATLLHIERPSTEPRPWQPQRELCIVQAITRESFHTQNDCAAYLDAINEALPDVLELTSNNEQLALEQTDIEHGDHVVDELLGTFQRRHRTSPRDHLVQTQFVLAPHPNADVPWPALLLEPVAVQQQLMSTHGDDESSEHASESSDRD